VLNNLSICLYSQIKELLDYALTLGFGLSLITLCHSRALESVTGATFVNKSRNTYSNIKILRYLENSANFESIYRIYLFFYPKIAFIRSKLENPVFENRKVIQ